ncbi:MAG: 2-oxoacid:acceptor oxidoreductase subunit alpha [Candidatus Omnitrophica bacterium]|nr:2-oxoacid:acceptor oxidoreductase subunit alpha [Candidatus Omnitrophota bacterium]
MEDFSILIGGKAGFGIDKAGLIIANILNRLGYRLYIYRDYPSLIRGGHTFSIIRAARRKIYSHKDKVEILLAFNQETFDLHKNRLTDNAMVIYDAGVVKVDGLGGANKIVMVPAANILKEELAPEITRNSCSIGALCKAVDMPWDLLDKEFRNSFSSEADINLKVARRGYDAVEKVYRIEPTGQEPLPVFTGNEAIGLGLVMGGLDTYISYPMTPTSPILHFLASRSGEFSLKVIHPESEIAVILMALGAAYCGEKTAVGTSGGGFCLMTEGVSFSAMAELPVVIVLGQRPGPSTGLPTYSSQTELHFALNAGQGEFARLVLAPGDAEEAYYLAQVALKLARKYRMPAIILSDKNMGEGVYSFDADLSPEVRIDDDVSWDGKKLMFVPGKDNVIKVNSYEHDEAGLTIEDPALTAKMQERRLQKGNRLAEELEQCEMVKTYGNKDSDIAVICWGSNKGVCVEAAGRMGLKVIQPLYMSPFPAMQMERAMKGVRKLLAVESNATAQLVKLMNLHALGVDKEILKYDGRPFSVDELERKLREAIA